MKRRSFVKNSALFAGALSIPGYTKSNLPGDVAEKSLIEWRIYHISRNSNAKQRLEKYFREALLPFLKKKNIKFAAFSDYGRNEPTVIYVMLAYPNPAIYFQFINELSTDTGYLQAAKEYNTIPASQAVYTRYESFLLEAFDRLPEVNIPEVKKGLFELRLYESYNEDAGNRKVTMFNVEEIDLFLKVGINPVFFGKILAGQHIPALLYMVAFENMDDRDAAWERFSAHPDWAVMRDKPQYADSVSNIQRIFLLPEPVTEA